MIYRFQSKADGDLLMLAPNGDHVLRLIGREPAPRGIIESKALPAAMAALEVAIAHDEQIYAEHGKEDIDPAPADGAPRVRLHQRIWPMLEMMKRAQAESADIVWGI